MAAARDAASDAATARFRADLDARLLPLFAEALT
jgi:hypothetical protein